MYLKSFDVKNLWKVQERNFFPSEEEDNQDGDVKDDDEVIEDEDEVDEEGKEDEDEKEDEEGDEKKGDKDEGELTRYSLKEINEKSPDFFKNFPDLKIAFFREQRFSEIFPTVEEAKTAAEQQAAYLELSEAVLSGDAARLINEIQNANPKALKDFSENYLKALEEESKDDYFEVLTPIVGNLLKNVYAHGVDVSKSNKKAGENIQAAARIIFRELGIGDYNDIERENTHKIGKSARMTDRKDDENDRKDKRDSKALTEDQERKYSALRADYGGMVTESLKEEISKGLDDIKGRDGLKNIAIEKIMRQVTEEMAKDQAFVNRMSEFWNREARLGFTGRLKDSYKLAYMGKAKTLIPKIRIQVRKDLELGKRPDKNNKEEPSRHTGGSRHNTGSRPIKQDEIKGKTAREILN